MALIQGWVSATPASMLEMVDEAVSKTAAKWRVGSSPTTGTITFKREDYVCWICIRYSNNIALTFGR